MTKNGSSKIAVILNGISFHKKIFFKEILPFLQQAYSVEVFETLTKNDGILLARKAAETFSYRVIFAAGGDGTLHQVVNGVMQACEKDSRLPIVGLIPLGSGNDFAKTANIKADAKSIVSMLNEISTVEINTGIINYTSFSGEPEKRYFVNVADIGMGPEVVQRVLDSSRMFGSEVAYYKSILSTFMKYKTIRVNVASENWTWAGKLRSLAIANGKFYGHGLCIAPDAILTDNLFNVFICGNVSVFDFIRHSGTMKKCRKIDLPEVKYLEGNSITMSSDEKCLIEGDGEVLGMLPASVNLYHKKIPMLLPQ